MVKTKRIVLEDLSERPNQTSRKGVTKNLYIRTRSRFDCVSFYNAGLLGLVSLEVLNHLATLNVLLREVIRSCVHLQ